MQTFHGFRPFREMVDGGQLPPGAIILVAQGNELSPYDFLGKEGKNPVYRVQHDSSRACSARNLLKGAVWYT